MTFDRTEFLHGLGGHTHQQAVHQLLMALEHAAQLRRYGRHGVKVVTRQQLGLAFFEPLLGLLGVAFGAGPIAATVINPEGLGTVVAWVQPPTELFAAAGLDIRKCSGVRRQHRVAILRPVLRAEATNHVGQFDVSWGKFLVRIRQASAEINHGGASFPRRDPR